MKLVDKIQEARSNKLSDYSKIYTPTAEVIEGIADEFALSFIDWYNTSETCERYLRRNYPKNITMCGSHYKKVLEVNKELLEIFKKEKGL
jgi:hypothetical protein